MKTHLTIMGLAISLAAFLVLYQGRLLANDRVFPEKHGTRQTAKGSGQVGTISILEYGQTVSGDFPSKPEARTSVNLTSYERKLAVYDAKIARNPDDATLYINKAIFQRMNLDIIGKIHTLEKALKRKNLETEGSELADIHFDLAILYGPLGVYEKGYYHFLVLHQIDQDYFKRADNGLEKYSRMINP